MSRNNGAPGSPIGRRDFAKTVAGGLGITWLGRSLPLLAQAPDVPDPERTGVTPTEVKVGMSAAFKGAIAGLGVEYYRGAMALFSEINAQGGISGRSVRLVALDDGYTPLMALRNTIRLVDEEKVFVLANYVGTPTLTRALPVIRQYRDRGIVLVGNLTGAQIQREDPYVDQVFKIRSSYRREMAATVDELWKLGIRKFGVFYQIDVYGRSGTDGVARALAARGAEIAAEATYRRGAIFGESMVAAMAHLRRAKVEAILCTGAYQASAAFVRDVRSAGWNVPISNISFVGCDAMLRLLAEEGGKTGRDFTRHLVNSQVVPTYDELGLPAVREYRDLMDRWKPAIPADLADPSYEPQKYSFNGLEGFLNAKVLVEGLRRAGPDLTRSRFKTAMESLADYDLGIGAAVTFSRSRHQGLDRVYFTTVSGGKWVGFTDWGQALAA